ncbi:hypothetical protein [Pseudophaeobacter leonis]|uniref:hypothetical protein n=1 Tax=Pseudophaeobacter leonis TaxID=1144477 RepID=UPI0009F1686B|nr:hypothetical protein [Pseudophaeobacter leonis]
MPDKHRGTTQTTPQRPALFFEKFRFKAFVLVAPPLFNPRVDSLAQAPGFAAVVITRKKPVITNSENLREKPARHKKNL